VTISIFFLKNSNLHMRPPNLLHVGYRERERNMVGNVSTFFPFFGSMSLFFTRTL